MSTPLPTVMLTWITAILALALLAPAPANAHAVLVGSSLGDPPRAVAGERSMVTLRFNSHLELDYVTVELRDTTGKAKPLEVRGGKAPGTVELTLPALGAGVYALDYHVVARDGHLTDGRLEFTVAP